MVVPTYAIAQLKATDHQNTLLSNIVFVRCKGSGILNIDLEKLGVQRGSAAASPHPPSFASARLVDGTRPLRCPAGHQASLALAWWVDGTWLLRCPAGQSSARAFNFSLRAHLNSQFQMMSAP